MAYHTFVSGYFAFHPVEFDYLDIIIHDAANRKESSLTFNIEVEVPFRFQNSSPRLHA